MPRTFHWGDAGPRILLVHGLSSSSESWWRVVEELAPHARLTAVDLRGHGASGAAERYTLSDYASDLPGEDWDAVVGHSLGGASAVVAAGRPGFTRSLVLLDPVLEVPAGIWDEVLADQLSELELDEVAIAAAKPHWHQRDRDAKLVGVRAVVPEAVGRTFTDSGRWDVVAETVALTVPTLILSGDPAVYTMLAPETASAIVEANPLIEVRVIPGAGHSPHRDVPDATLRAMREWLL